MSNTKKHQKFTPCQALHMKAITMVQGKNHFQNKKGLWGLITAIKSKETRVVNINPSKFYKI